MRIELLTTGDELVSGQIVDTNSPWLDERIFRLGATVARHLAVGDDLDELVAVLREVAARADVAIVSGGLGPTLDDLTVDAVARAFDRSVRVDETQLDRIRTRLARVGRLVTANNERQARVPDGADVLGNDFGTATCFRLEVPRPGGRCELFFVPGVPRELKGICEQHVLPSLASRLAASGVHRAFRVLKCLWIAESHMDAQVRPLLAAHPHVRYGTRTTYPENHVKLLAEGASPAEAEARCEALAAEVRAALGDVVFGGETDTLPDVTRRALASRGLTVAFGESMSAGLAASLLAEASGASEVLLGSAVTYAASLKERWLDVPASLLAVHGSVSEPVAAAMAEGTLARSGARLAVALTGYAEGGTDELPAGTVFAAIAGEGPTRVWRRRMLQGRNDARRGAAFLALDLVRRRALGLPDLT